MTKNNKKMIATAYIHLVKDKDGNIEKVTEETIRRYIQEQEKGGSNSSTQ